MILHFVQSGFLPNYS